MPEEFEGLMNDLLAQDASTESESVEPEGQEDPAGEVEPEGNETESETSESEDQGEQAENKDEGPDIQEVSEETQESKANRAFAEMRAKNTKYERALARAAKMSNLSVDEFLEQMENKTLEQQAKTLGTNPELLKRLESLEAENESYRNSQIQMHLTREFGKVEQDLGVSKKDLQEFTTELMKRGHNFQDTSVDYTLLYRGMYHDKLIEKERQKWIARQGKAQNSATTVGKSGKRDSSPETIESMADLDKILDEIDK